MISVEVVYQFDALIPEWEALAEAVGAPPFLGPDWIAVHSSAFDAARLAVGVVRRDGRLAAVLPLALSGDTGRSLTSAQTPQFGLVTDDAELAGHVIGAFTGLGISRLVLSYVDRDDPLVGALRRQSTARGQRLVERVMLRSPFVRVDGTLDDYRSRLSSSFRADLRRRDRRLAERGDVKFEVCGGSDGLEEMLAQGWLLEAAGWKGALGTAVAAHPSTRRFYAEIARRAAARDRLRLYFLRLDRSPIAFYFGLEQQRILYLLKGGFDPAYARFSPGMLLMERLIARAFEGGLDRIELLGGNEPHKLRWTSSSHERLSLQSFARSPVRTAQWAALAYARPLALRVGLDRAFRAARDRARVALTAVRAGRS